MGSPVPATVIAQRNLHNRVSYVRYTDNHLTSAFNQATFYTYDILGNVDTLLQDYGCGTCGTQATYNMMNRNGRKKITYQYDLVSGKVNMMLYQNGWNDMWLHRYTYDAENRLTLVETSNDSLVWEKDARYEYYRHGPFARTVLGDQLVQGIDYAYTLQSLSRLSGSWLKGMNSTGATATHDMGGDGRTGSLNLYTARDALGFNLNYFGGDYTSINSTVTPFPKYYGLTTGGLPDSLYRPLYNGNISSMATNIRMFQNQYGGQSLFYNYKYDQLNRITRQDVYKNFDRVNNHYNALDIKDSLFRERIAYDANGNILKYHRYNSGGDSEMDSLTYKYYAGTNRLRRVRDSVRSGKFGSNGWEVIVDIDDQPDSNYVYDEIGNIVRDSAEKITSIKWNVYGKITEITRSALATDKNKTTRMLYTYDAAGNRISKVEEKAGTASKDYTWYARDAQGNIMAIYKASGSYGIGGLDSLRVAMSEQMIYGSSRLGMYGGGAEVDNINNTGPTSREFYGRGVLERGDRQYELSNHLGNVLTTISDRKFGVSSGAIGSLIDYYEPDIASANDYYPFGMVSRVGQTTTGVQYRFGFNGQEMSNEIKGYGSSYTAEFWEYDSRIGRRWNLDPIPTAGISLYSVFENNPIWFNDIDGDRPIKRIKNATTNNGKDGLKMSADVEITVKVKVLDLSGKGEKLASSLRGQYWDLDGGKGKASSYHKYDHEGKELPKNKGGGYKRAEVSGTVKVSYDFTIINSVNQIEKGDNVLIIAENVKDLGANLPGVTVNNYISVMDINSSSDIEELQHTAIHEVTRQLGLRDEYTYKNNKAVKRYDDNLMDLKGWKLTDEQRGKLIGEATGQCPTCRQWRCSNCNLQQNKMCKGAG